ncbi:hypothetical protein [Amorphus orientalis]|uniref:Skp family chaperone for outer membrane proteins n=1 Tax=Amorphus orientalis TaxID=649198 RepID=A0AAE4ASV7_9HYPH|nr:hypothetical protein [Amorphus orientalis]MDQ0315673.1 Skp family chaperone for outer membrane proteins [Amorphus orientalis]
MYRLKFLLAAAVAAFVGFAAASPPAAAQTVGYADAIKILAQSCGQDINTYCKTANIGNFGIQKCLESNASKISATCKADYVRVYELLQKRHAAQEAVPQLCARDAQQLCGLNTPGSVGFQKKGSLFKCLLKAEPSVGNRCNQAITDAGYR